MVLIIILAITMQAGYALCAFINGIPFYPQGVVLLALYVLVMTFYFIV